LVKLKILSAGAVRKQDKKCPLWKNYFMHGISHHLGYDVHDTSDRSAPLKAGMVLTCEPGLYIPEEGTGIRLENDILITNKAPLNLMKSIPIDPDEIEEIMQTSKQ
jgi:Xaa-Pro aminopeptidase